MLPVDVLMTKVPLAVSTLTTVPVMAILLLPEPDVTATVTAGEVLAA
jgi:hypothetical protein